MRYVLSDIHGEIDLFCRLLEKIGLSDLDELYICGDFIDKGEDSVGLLRLVSSMPNVHAIIGNHDYLFLKYYHSLLGETSDESLVLSKLREYFPSNGHLLGWGQVDWLDSLPAYIETDEFICTHAGVPLDKAGVIPPLEGVSVEELVHDRRFKDPELFHTDPRCVFFGHTETACICGKDKILAYKRRNVSATGGVGDFYKVHLDTGAWRSGVLGCVCIDTMKPYYVTKN